LRSEAGASERGLTRKYYLNSYSVTTLERGNEEI
jgi:hypothetical protein